MNKKIFLILLMMLLLVSGCSEFYEESRSYDIAYKEGVKLDVESETGDIRILNWRRDYVAIDVRIKAHGSSNHEVKRLARRTKINISEGNNYIRVRTYYPDGGFTSSVSVDYSIKLPRDFDGYFKSDTGDISVESLFGDLNIITDNGDIDVGSITGNAKIESDNGDIDFNEIYGILEVQSDNGDIDVEYLNGQSNINTSNGKIELNIVDLDYNSYNQVFTDNGDIEVTINNNINTKLTARTDNGYIDIMALDMDFEALRDNYLIGSIGFKDAALEIETNNGDIELIGEDY